MADEQNQGSILEELRRRNAAQAEQQETHLEIPGYNGQLWAKYHLIADHKELAKIGKRVAGQFKGNMADQTFYGIMDTMIAANDGLYYQDGEEFKSIAEALEGPDAQPITYSDSRLVDFFAWNPEEINSARAAVARLFGNDNALLEHGRALAMWFRDTSKDVNEDFLSNLT